MNVNKFQVVESLRGDDERDTELLKRMAREAKDYIASFHWAKDIEHQYLAFGVGGVVAIFYIDFVSKISDSDKTLWVVVGDLPSAYLVADAGDTPKEVLETYCNLMTDWSENVMFNGIRDDVFPVKADRTVENANMLKQRVRFLRDEIIPQM